MSKCGNCRNKTCTCQLNGGPGITVAGLGATYNPFRARPSAPAYRPVATVHTSSSQTIAANTDTRLVFESSELPFTGGIGMWIITNPFRITIPIDGLYLIGGFAAQYFAGSAQVVSVWIAKNGVSTTPLVKRTMTSQTGNFYIGIDVMTLTRFSAGDYIELWIRSNSAVTTTTSMLGYQAAPSMWVNWMGA